MYGERTTHKHTDTTKPKIYDICIRYCSYETLDMYLKWQTHSRTEDTHRH